MTQYNYRIAEVLDIVCDEAGICPKAIKGPRRTFWIARHRQIVMYLCRRFTTKSTTQIAKVLGRADHSSVIDASREITKLIKENDDWRRLLNRLEDRLKSGAPKIKKPEVQNTTPAPEKSKSKSIIRRLSKKPSHNDAQTDPRQQPSMRKCLGLDCGKEFQSQHAGNRICPRCTYLQNAYRNRIDARHESATA